MAGFDNDVVYANNADFSVAGAGGGSETNGLQTNGQLWIGRTAVNVGGTHVSVGNLTSPDASVTIGYSAPNITLAAGSAMGTVKTLTPDLDFDGTAATPVAPQVGNINFLSYNPTNQVTNTYNSTGAATGDMKVEHKAWLTSLVVDASTTIGSRGTFSTIASALTAASSGQTIFIRSGTYTENLTMKAGVNLCAFTCDAFTPNVTIIGKCTFTTAGTVSCSGIRFQTNSDYAISVTGSAASILNLVNCYLNFTNNTGIQFTTSSGSAAINCYYCIGDLTGGSIAYFTSSSAGLIDFEYCFLDATGGSGTASTISAGTFNVQMCKFNNIISASGTATGVIRHSRMLCGNNTCVTSTSSGAINCNYNLLQSGSATAVSAGGPVTLDTCALATSNAASVSGSNTVTFINCSCPTATPAITTTTQVPLTCTNNAVKVKAPGAYPYTALPQDYLILVDTSSARTINLNASPVTGQTYRIKDNVGSAGSNAVTITPAAGTIDGAAGASINVAYGSVDLCYNGTEWSLL